MLLVELTDETRREVENALADAEQLQIDIAKMVEAGMMHPSALEANLDTITKARVILDIAT